MANKVNTVFVAALTGSIVIAGGAATFAYKALQKTAEEHLAEAVVLQQEKDWEGALTEIGKAVHEAPDNIEAKLQMLHAIRTFPVSQMTKAEECRVTETKLLYDIANTKRTDEGAWKDYFQHLMQEAAFDARLWIEIHQAANKRLESNPDDTLALCYSAVPVASAPNLFPNPNTRSQVGNRLNKVLEQDPDNTLAQHAKAQWMLFLARETLSQGLSIEAAQEQLDTAHALALAIQKTPTPSLQQQLWVCDTLYQLARFDAKKHAEEYLTSILKLQEVASENVETIQNPMVLIETNQRLKLSFSIASRRDGQAVDADKAVISLLERHIAAHPQSPLALGNLAETLLDDDQPDKAFDTFQKVIAIAKNPAPANTFFFANRQANQAAYQCALIRLRQAMETPEGSKSAIQLTQKTIDSLQSEGGSVSQTRVLHLKAMQQVVEGKHTDAIKGFEKAIEQSATEPNRMRIDLLEDAITVGSSSQAKPGVLRNWLETAVQVNPRDYLKQFQLANLYLQADANRTPGRDYLDLAKKQATRLSALLPNAPLGAWIQAQAITRGTEPDYAGALALMEGFQAEQLAGLPRYFSLMPNWMAKLGKKDEAIAFMEIRFENTPRDVDNAVRYANTLESTEEKQAVMDRLASLDFPENILKQLNTLVFGSTQEQQAMLADRAQAKINTNSNRIDLAELHIAWASDKQDKAIELANEMIKAGIEIETAWFFKLNAIYNKDGIAAAQQNIQQAQKDTGVSEMFWRARLALFDGDTQRAQLLTERALESNPTNSMAQCDLGQAFLAKNDPQEALKAFTRSLDLSGMAHGRRALFGMFQANMAMGRQQEALQALQALARNKLFYTNLEWLNYAAMEEQYGDVQRAIALRESLAQTTPGNHGLRRQLALTYAKQGDEDKAYAAMDALIQDEGNTVTNVGVLATLDRQFKDGNAGLERIAAFLESDQAKSNYAAWQLLGEYQFESGNPQQALDAYQKAIELEPKDRMPATRVLTQHLVNANANELAEPLLANLIQTFPDEPAIQANFIDVTTALGHFDKALPIAQKMDKATGALTATLASKDLTDGQPKQAVARIDERLDSAPQPTQAAQGSLLRLRSQARLAAIQAGQINEQDAQSALNANVQDLALLNQMFPDQPQYLYEWTQAMRRAGQSQEALRLLEKLTISNPTPIHNMALAETLLETGAPTRALQVAQTGFAAQPQSPQWARLVAAAYRDMKQSSNAANAWAQAADLSQSVYDVVNAAQAMAQAKRYSDLLSLANNHPAAFQQNPPLQSLRGLAFNQTGNHDAAKQAFAQAMVQAQNPDQLATIAIQAGSQQGLGKQNAIDMLNKQTIHPQAWRAMAIARLHMAAKNFDAAAETLAPIWNQSTGDEALDLSMAQTMGIIQQQLGNAQDAREAYAKALELDPNRMEVLNNLAYLLTADLNMPQEALPLAQKASDLSNHEIPAIEDTLGWVLVELGQFQAAREVLEPITRSAPDMALGHLHLGLALAGQDNPSATVYLNRAIRVAEQTGETEVAEQAKEKLESLLAPAGAP